MNLKMESFGMNESEMLNSTYAGAIWFDMAAESSAVIASRSPHLEPNIFYLIRIRRVKFVK